MMQVYKVPLLLTPQPEGGYTITSRVLPELLTEGDTLEEALAHIQDALQAVIELYDDLGKPFPPSLRPSRETEALTLEYAIALP